jgi:glycosyltransferase involved in cell wall biosynthesis
MIETDVLAFMISRAEDPKRLAMFQKTVEEAIATAGMDFDLVLWPMTSEAKAVANLLMDKYPDQIEIHGFLDGNVGQHVVMNSLIEHADDEDYDYLLRLDDDVKFLTKRWLRKMVDAAEELGGGFIISPSVVGLRHPPESTPEVEQMGVKFRVLMGAIGGICRLHNVETLVNPQIPYVSDVRGPLGFGDATGIGRWCQEAMEQHGIQIWMIYLSNVRVKHAKGTTLQVKDNPEYHENHDLFQKIPYVPIWRGEE